MLIQDYQLVSIQSEEDGLFLSLNPCASGGYILPFSYWKGFDEETTPEKFEEALFEEFYLLYYGLIQGFEKEVFGIDTNGDIITLLLPSHLWVDQFRDWYQQQNKNPPILECINRDKPEYITSKVGVLKCGAFSYNSEYWSMRIWLEKNKEIYYSYDIKSIQQIHWCVAITQAYRKKEPLAFKINESTNEILDVRKVES